MGRTASPDNGDRAALTIPHDPSGNGVLNSDSWQKIRKTAANLAQLAQMLLTLLLRFNWRILPNQANGSARPTPAAMRLCPDPCRILKLARNAAP
jgi:hypothetical protein